MPDDIETLRAEVADLCDDWLRAGRYQPRNDCWVRSFDPEFSAEMGRRRLIGISWPTTFGGRGLSQTARLAVAEELLRRGAPVAAHWTADRQIGPAVLRYGTDLLKEKLLPEITAGRAVCSLGMSEPEAGSDLASVRTRATEVEGGFIIDGQKVWTSFAHRATHLYVLARTDPRGEGNGGLTEFVLDMTSPGISTSPILDMAGEHHFNEVFLDGVFVPDTAVLGTRGDGWRQAVQQLSLERGGPERFLSTYPLLASSLERARGARSLEAVGSLAAELFALRAMAADVAASLDRGDPAVDRAATLKLVGSEFEAAVLETARSVGIQDDLEHGDEYRRTLLSSPGFAIRGGAADVLLHILSRSVSRG